jgi:hypothetical protein
MNVPDHSQTLKDLTVNNALPILTHPVETSSSKTTHTHTLLTVKTLQQLH